MIRDPNMIVDKLVADVRTAFGDHLLGVVLYGSAVTHEFKPGTSDVNIALVLDAMPASLLEKGASVLQGWMRRGLAAPLFLTPAYLEMLPVDYPVEILDIQNSYRMLWGDDPFSVITISRSRLQRQCRRELTGLALQLRKEYIQQCTRPSAVRESLLQTVRALLPLFKAILLLHDRKVPSSKTEVIAAVEDLFGLGVSVLSEVYNRSNKGTAGFDQLLRIVEKITDHIGTMTEGPESTVRSDVESLSEALGR